jgi:hypothetical protein
MLANGHSPATRARSCMRALTCVGEPTRLVVSQFEEIALLESRHGQNLEDRMRLCCGRVLSALDPFDVLYRRSAQWQEPEYRPTLLPLSILNYEHGFDSRVGFHRCCCLAPHQRQQRCSLCHPRSCGRADP